MSKLSFVRTPGLPGTLAASTMYLVRDAVSGKLSFVVTDANGVEAHGLNTTDVQTMIETHAPEALAAARNISMTGDGTWTVSFDGSADASAAFTLANTGVAAGSYTKVTVDAKGRVTAGAALAATDLPAEITSNTSGNAATADLAVEATVAVALKTARTINGVAFDGSENITINAKDATPRIAVSEKGATNGVAPLVDGLVPAAHLPSYVDDVIEVEAFDQLPGEANDPGTNGAPSKGKIYVVVAEGVTTIYRWAGDVAGYITIPSGLGTSDSAIKLKTARSIAITGDATWSVTFDGSENVTAALTLANSGIVAGEYAVATYDSKGRAVSGRALVMADIPELDYTKVISSRSVYIDGAW
jgi:phage-related tail fiber protein